MAAIRTGTVRTKGNSRGKIATRSNGKKRPAQMNAKKRKQMLAEPDMPHLGPMDAEESPFTKGKGSIPSL